MTVIVIACNELDFVKCCLTLLQSQRHVVERIIVVDNSSSNEMTSYLGEQNDIQVMHITKNVFSI